MAVPGPIPRLSPATLAIAGGFSMQAGLFSLAFAISRSAGHWATALLAESSQLLVAGGTLILVAGLALIGVARSRAANPRLEFSLPLATSVVSGVLCVLVAEAGVRLLAVPDPLGRRLGDTILIPYDWPSLATHSRQVLDRSEAEKTIYIADSHLGWTIAPSRTSDDGLYASSIEGLRSRTAGERELDSPPEQRIALFGDSFAFSEEASFDDSLALKLEHKLGNGAQVLNFGVPGFGIDQAILRFERVKDDWQPPVAILTFIEDDLLRTGNIYTFLKVFWGVPMSKPRFILRGDSMQLENVPTLAGPELFDRSSIFDLPLLDYEIEFSPERWYRHPLHVSYLLRFLNGVFPTWPPRGAAVTDDAIAALSVRLLQDFVRSAAGSGITPLIVYLPTEGDYSHRGSRPLKERVLPSLAARGIAVTDLTPCFIDHVHRPDLFMPQGHYTGYANEIMAECLAPEINAARQGRTATGPAQARTARE